MVKEFFKYDEEAIKAQEDKIKAEALAHQRQVEINALKQPRKPSMANRNQFGIKSSLKQPSTIGQNSNHKAFTRKASIRIESAEENKF